MAETLEDFLQTRPATPDRPLRGRSVLVVEDSRYVSDALRMMCRRSGARLRRADSLAAARRHLCSYRPCVLIVDLGLPDGSGLDLIRDVSQSATRIDALLAMSGDDSRRAEAIAAGADGFMEKPLVSLAAFQATVLAHLPPETHPPGPREMPSDIVRPDDFALADDLRRAECLLEGDTGGAAFAYVMHFLSGLAKCSRDAGLAAAVATLDTAWRSGRGTQDSSAALRHLLKRRIDARSAV